MSAVMQGRDTLLVLPTGGGKSACYQVPALLIDGPTVVASPLIALQRDEIVERLHMRDALQVVRGFDRPNLHLEVVTARSGEQKQDAVVLRAAAEEKPGIVYAATRKDAERYADALADLGLRACSYHAGMRAADREEVHSRFLDDDLDVVVATTAFGMG